MIQPNGDKKRKSVATTHYDSQFELQGIDFEFPEIDLEQTILPEGYIGAISRDKFEEYEKLGVRYSPSIDIMNQLAENQTNLNKIGNVAVRSGVGALMAAVEPFGYLLDVENHIKALQGADRDYDNFFTKGVRGIEESTREAFPIYTKEEQPDIMSADWWFQNTDQVLRSVGYLVPGGALFKGVGLVGKSLLGAAARTTGMSISGTGAAQALTAGSALGSATLLNYGEHAVSAAKHIEENMPELIASYVKQGMDPGQAEQQAKSVLSKQAAEIIKGGRINILWQSISQANLFRGINHSRRLGKLKEATKGQGVREGLKRFGIEALTESLEEVNTGFQEVQAQYKTDLELGKVVPDERPTWEKFAEHVTSYQGITEGLLGALGAGPMTLATSVLQIKGNIDALEQVKKTERELGLESEQRIKDLSRTQVRGHAIMNALRGTSENFMEILETYKNATAEEAQSLGFESNYKELAEEYIKDAKFIEDAINNEIMNPLRNNQEEAFILVNHKLNEYYALQDIENYKVKLEELKAKRDKLFVDIENNVEDKALHDIRNSLYDRSAMQKTIAAFENSIAEIQKNNLPMSKETNETLRGEIKNLEDAKSKLKEIDSNLQEKFVSYAQANEMNQDQIVEAVKNLESAGDIDIEIEANTSKLEAAKIRRKNNTEQYQEYVTDPSKLEAEGKKKQKEKEAARKKKEESQKSKQKAAAKANVKSAEQKAKAAQTASQAQQAAGGVPLTADSPIGAQQPSAVEESEAAPREKESPRPNQVSDGSFASPIFDGDVTNEGDNPLDASRANIDNAEQMPDTYAAYFKREIGDEDAKQVQSSSSIAFISVPYRVIDVKNAKGEIVKKKVSISNTKTPASEKIESVDALLQGSEVTLRLVGPADKALTKQELIAMDDKDVDALPVAIYQNGVKVGSLHALDWIRNNTAEDSIESELTKAKNIRRALARGENENSEITTKVTFKGYGKILQLFAEDSAGGLLLENNKEVAVNTTVSKALPNFDRLQIGVTNGGNIYTGYKVALKEQTVMPLRQLNYLSDGRVVVNLPTPNGKLFPSILFVDNVPAQQADTIIGAANSYQNDQTETYSTIQENTGVVFGRKGDAEALHKFVNRYIYSPNVPYQLDGMREGNMDQNTVLVFTPKKFPGMIQIVDIQNRLMYTNDPVFFQKNPQFVSQNNILEVLDLRDEAVGETASELLQRKLVSISSKMINQKDEFTDVILDRQGAVVDVSQHSTYNAFKGQHLKTDINGKNFIEKEDGSKEYTYMTQPLVVLDTSFSSLESLEAEVENADQVAAQEDDIFLSPKFEAENQDEQAIDNFQENEITKAMQEELSERFFDVSIITLPQQLEAINAVFGVYANGISRAGKSFKGISSIIKKGLQKIVDTKQTRKNKKAAIQHLLDNYDLKAGSVTVEGLIIEKLSKLDILPKKEGFISKDLTDVEIDQMYDEMLQADGFTQEDFVKDIYDFEFYKTNKKKTASGNIKLFLSTIAKNETSWLGGPFKKAVEYQEMYDTLKATLSEVPGTFADQKAAISKKAEEFNNPVFKTLLERLDGQSETLKRQFVVAMSGTRLNFVFLKTSPMAGGSTSQVMEVDRYNTTVNIKNKWFRNLLNSKLTKTIEINGIPETIVDQKYREKIQKKYEADYNRYKENNTLTSDDFVRVVQKYLNEMGIEVPFEGLKFLAQKANRSDIDTYLRRKVSWEAHVDPTLTTTGKPKGMMSSLFKSFRYDLAPEAEAILNKVFSNRLTKQEAEKQKSAASVILGAEEKGGFIYGTNPFDGPNYERVVYGLLNLTVDFEGSIYGDSFRDSKGNMIYPYQNNFGLKRLFNEYTSLADNQAELKKLVQLSYNKNSVWAQGLLNDIKYLEVSMFDATNFQGAITNRKDQGRFLQEMTLFDMFANQGNENGYFFPITTADKDIAPVVKAPKLQNVIPNLEVVDGQVKDIKGPAMEQIVGYAIDEYNRIQNHKQGEFNRGPYEEGANYFYMFDYLNAYKGNEDIVGMMPDKAVERIASTVKQNVIDQINSHISRLQELGLQRKFLDGTYFRKVLEPQDQLFPSQKDKFAAAIADFNLNYIVANNEIVKLFGNDPAHAYKKSKKPNATLRDHIKESLNNYEKRKADLISPASTPEYTNPVATIATAVDAVRDGIERTDAQEYGTIQEMLESKLSAGKLPIDIKNRIQAAYDAAKADANNPTNFFKLSDVLTKEEIEKYKKIMMADKPVFVQNDIQIEQDSNNKLFRKSHIRYLWPEETTGYGMDNIRVAMENAGIDRLGHLTSDKTGAVDVVEIYDKDGNVKSIEEVTAALKEGARPISRSGLGIQQEKGTDTGEISYSTQLDVLLFDDMLGKKLSTGESLQDLRDQKEALQRRFMQLGAQGLFKKLGIKINASDGSVYIPNPTALSEMLREEAIARKWTAKDISELALKDIDGAIERVFKSPLTFNHARKNIDALVLSLINKAITKVKLPGEALVQASSAGFESKGAMSWAEYVSQGEFDKIKNGITLIEGENQLDETVGLQGPRPSKGKLLPGQILISPVFTDSKSKTIDLTSKKYTTITNGVRYLRKDALPKELLERILYRIPGQGKPSVSAVEIVGFLPKTSTSTIIVPDAIIDQMGSDFDWDTAYTYMKQYDVVGNKIVVKSDLTELQKLQDEYYELFKKVIFDPVTFKATDKLDNTDLKQAADIVDAIVGKESIINSPSYVTTNIDNTISQRTGKQLIGPASLAAVMHAALQGKGITINVSNKTLKPISFIFFKDNEGNNLELTTISSYRGKSDPYRIEGDSRTASDNVRTVQNAAVDNANEAVLGRVGINNATVDVSLFTLMYKDGKSGGSIHAEQLVYFLRQQAIEMYSEQFDYFSAQIEGGFRTEEQIRNDAFNATMVKLAELAGIDPEVDYTANISEYRKDSEGEFLTFNSEDFIRQLETSNNPNPSYYKKQMAILAGFKQLQNSSDPVRKLQRGVMSPRTKGMGSTIFEGQRTIDNMNEIYEDGLSGIGGLENLEGGQLKELYLQFDKVYTSLSSILPFSNASHKQLIKLWQSFTGARNVTQKTREQLFNAMLNKSFARAFEQTFNEDITQARIRLMADPDNNIAIRVAKLQETEFGKRNLFISRLLPISINSGIPASISYISSKQDDVADRMSIDFTALYMSPEEGHRELFEDIVKYTYITGGVQSAGNFSKFIPTAYLDKIGFYDALRMEERHLNTSRSAEAPSTMDTMIEFFQHNPNRAVMLDRANFNRVATAPIQKIQYEGASVNYEFTLKQPENTKEFDAITYEDQDGNKKYLQIISFKSTAGKTELYMKMGTNEQGHVFFRKIGLKGYSTGNFVKVEEYGGLNKFTEDGRLVMEGSIVYGNNVPSADSMNISVPETTAKTPEVPETSALYGFDPVKVEYTVPGREGVKELLNTVLENTSNEIFGDLASVLYKSLDTKGSDITSIDLEDALTVNGRPAKGAYRGGKITIDLETVTRNSDLLEETVLHEYVHGFLSKEVSNTDSKFSRQIKYLTNAANTALKNAVKRGEIDKTSIEYQELAYAFGSPQEFVTMSMTNATVQSFLNTVPSNKNIWQKFKQLVKDFLNTIAKELGIEINKDSLLAESVDTILNHITESTPSISKVQSVVQDAQTAAGILPLNPSISAQQHAIASISKIRNNEYTEQEFRNALKQHQKQQQGFASPNFQGRVDTKDEFITVFQERASRLRNKITDKVLKTAEGKKMQERLNVYEKQIDDLKRSKGYLTLQAIMTTQLGWAEGIVSSVDPTNVEITEALNIVDMYNYESVTKEYLSKADRRSGNVWNEMLLDKSRSASSIKTRLLDKLYEIAAQQINAGLPEETVTAEDLKAMGEEGFIKSNFLDLSKFKHPLVRTLDKYLKSANRNADSEIEMKAVKIDSAFAEIENHPSFKKDPNMFFQKDDKGNLTGYFISPYSAAYTEAKNKLFTKYFAAVRNAKSEVQKNNAAALLGRNLNAIEIAIDVRWFIPGMEKFNSPFKSQEEYIGYLDDQLGEEQRKELVSKAEKEYKKYKELEDQKMLDIELGESGGAGILQQYQEEITSRQQAFKERYSPIYYLNSRYGGGRALAKNRGWEKVVTAPVKKNKYYDSKYKAINNDPQLKKFHDFYTETMKDLMKLLPEGLVATLPENFFPYAKRGFIEQVQSEGISSIFTTMNKGALADYFFNIDQELTLDPQLETRGARDPNTGELLKNIPVRMLRGQADEKSYDIRKVMKMFTAMSVAYDFKSQVEDKILLLQRLLREADEIQLDSKGDPMYKKIQKRLRQDTRSGALENVNAAVKYAIDSNLYGVNKDSIEQGVVFSKQVADIKRRFESLKDSYQAGEIDDSVYLEEKGKLDEEMEKLGTKPKSLKKPLERLIEYTQLKGLGWNLMSGVNNLSFGTIANYVHAAGNEDYTNAQLHKAYALCMMNALNPASSKVYNLASKYGILFEQLDAHYGKERKTKFNFLGAVDPFFLQTSTEYMNQIAPFIAKMFNTPIDNKGNTLYDMYDNDGNIKPEFKNIEQDWTTKLDADTENKFTAFRDATIEMNKLNHGNYDPNSALAIKRNIWGRIGTQFRTWAFEGFNTRWGEKVYNAQLGRFTEGRYRAYRDVGAYGTAKMVLQTILNTLTLGYGVSEESLRGDIKDDLTFANMRKNMAGIKFYGSVMAVGAFFKALAEGEDEDEAKKTYVLIINSLYRLEQDAEFYASPGTTFEVLRNPAPIMKTITDFTKAVYATGDYVIDKDKYIDSRRDPLSKKWMKVVPFGNSIRSVEYLMETQIEKD